MPVTVNIKGGRGDWRQPPLGRSSAGGLQHDRQPRLFPPFPKVRTPTTERKQSLQAFKMAETLAQIWFWVQHELIQMAYEQSHRTSYSFRYSPNHLGPVFVLAMNIQTE